LGTKVLAINPASVKAHQNYCNQKGFRFPILSDPEREVVAAYRCQKEEGKGVLRTVYAIDPDGKVVFAERGHADYNVIMDTIRSLR
jgi:peroxiredoxin Q/BCP